MGVIAETAVKVRADTAGFHSEVSRGVLSSVGRVAAGAAAVFGGIQLGKGLFNATIKSAADFQTTLKVLQATTGSSNADLKRLSGTAIKLGADVRLPGTSAKSAADAMLQLGRAGFSTNQIIAASRGVLLLSTAAQVDNATAADMVSKAIGAFGLKARDANMVVNDFAGAANASQSSLADVGAAVTQAGAGFHALRIPVSDAATAIAEMAKQGITGGMAGAALNVAFTRLATPTKAAKTVMQDMGVQLFDNNGKFVGLRAAIEQMSPRLAKMTDQQRLHTLSVLGGTRGMKALSDVLGVGVKNWDATHRAVTRAGQAQAIANAQTSGFHGAVLGLQNTLGTLALKIGIAVLPKVTELVRFLGRLAAAKNIGVAVSILWSGIKSFATNVTQAIGDALFGATRVVHIGRTGTRVDVDQGLIARIHQSISDGIAATDWSAVGSRIGTAISGAIKVSTDALNGLLNGMLAWLGAHKSQIADIGVVIGLTMVSKLLDPSFWAAHWQLIGGIALSAITIMFPEGALARIGVRALGFLLKPFAVIGTRLAALGVEGVLGLSGSIERALGPLAGKIALGIGDAILRATGAVVRAMVDLGAKLITAIINKISGLGVLFRTAIFTAIVAVIGSLIGAAVAKAVDLISGVVRALASLPGKIDFKAILLAVVVGPLGIVAGLAAAAAIRIAVRIAGGIKTAASKLAGLAGDIAGKIQAALGDVAGRVGSWAAQIGTNIYNGVLGPLRSLAGAISALIPGGGGGGTTGKVPQVPGKTTGGGGGSGPGGGSSAPANNNAGLQTQSFVQNVQTGLANVAPKLIAAMDATLRDVFAKSTTSVLAGVQRMKTALGTIGDRLGESLVGLRGQMASKLAPIIEEISNASPKAAKKLIAKAKAVEKPIQDAFVAWIARGKAAFDAKSADLIATVDATFAKAQAKIDVWKAKATPTEALIAARQAQAAEAAVVQAVAAAKAAFGTLKIKFDSDWATLLATQAANIQKLRDQQAVTFTDTAIAGHEFDKTLAATASDPLAVALLAADKSLIGVKARYAAGTATLAELNAAVDVFDVAQLAAQGDTDAQKLLADYTTWQNLVAQTAAGEQAITDQIGVDATARQGLIDQYNIDRQTAQTTLNDALVAQDDYYIGVKAEKERIARDAEAAALNVVLVARHNRILEHLKNVIHAHDLHFDELARMAAKSGGDVGANLAKAMRESIPLVDSAAKALAQVVSRYLKTGSPTEAGPMSDLNRWWRTLAPTLISSLDSSGIQAKLAEAVTPPSVTASGSVGSAGVPGRDWNTQRMEMLLERIEKHTATTAANPPKPTEVHVASAMAIDASVYRSRR